MSKTGGYPAGPKPQTGVPPVPLGFRVPRNSHIGEVTEMPTWDEIGGGKTVRITHQGRTWVHTIYPGTRKLVIGDVNGAIILDFPDGFPQD